MNEQMLAGLREPKMKKIQCIDSVMQCGWQRAHLQILDEGQNHQFQKRIKISLRNRQTKRKKNPKIDHSPQFMAYNISKNAESPKKRHLNQLINNFQQVSKSSYTDIPFSALALKNDRQTKHQYKILDFPKLENRIQKNQNRNQNLSYEQEFQKILFCDSQQISSQIGKQLHLNTIYYQRKKLSSLCVLESRSMASSHESIKSSIILPFKYSHKLTASTILHTKTSQSIILPELNKQKASFIISQVISDQDFDKNHFVNPFNGEKQRIFA